MASPESSSEAPRQLTDESLRDHSHEEASIYPPIGQLSFERIKEMSEGEIDYRLKQHLGGADPFAEGEHYEDPKRDLKLKRLLLANVEAIAISSEEVLSWYDPNVRLDDAGKVIRVLISIHASRAYKQRAKYVRYHGAREATVLAPQHNGEEVKLLQDINNTLISNRLITAPLAVIDILNTSNLPTHQPSYTGSHNENHTWPIARILKLYKLALKSNNITEVCRQIGDITENEIEIARSRYLTKRARDLHRQIHGRKVLG